ncbi:protein patched homolog 3-like [Portunus trituberculatus]|uniref:protein patched homolog 3-like n=1 Tax=Portunus trituberculatus TaxID=210409 RepID=UPI001E1CF1D4|nr:protein patched homolog 3-like [Portunus trituberculatus]
MLETRQKMGKLLSAGSARLVRAMELTFNTYGRLIATSPIVVIVVCLVMAAGCGVGLLKFEQEDRPTKLWTPEGSESVRVEEWMEENFVSDTRLNMAIYVADNVLEKNVLLEMLRVHELVTTTTTSAGITWNTTCSTVPIIPSFSYGRRRRDAATVRQKRQTNSDFDFSRILPRDDYCQFQESIQEVCLENGLLDVFGYDRDFLTSLTREQILDEINDAQTSSITGFPLNVTQYLSQVRRDEQGYILGARAASHMWFTRVNRSALESGVGINDAGTGTQVDANTHEWEQTMVRNLLNPAQRPPEVQFYIMSASSFGTVGGENIQSDLQFLSLGFGVVFVFVVLMLGRRNHVEARPLLSLMGLSCVGLAIVVSYGTCSAYGVPYGPVNSILPFLLLGLGIDDMFVILEAWQSLSSEEQQQPLRERIGLALGRAGVAITVTSLTDFLAFAVGCTTVLPALRYFCIYSAIGIVSVYFFQATFFVACLTLDQRRLEDRRHGLFWCWKMSPEWSPSGCSQRDLCNEFFSRFYAKFLLHPAVRVIVILWTSALFFASTWGLTNLRQEFDPIWFLPQDSYLYGYFEKQRDYFPSSEEPGSVYLSNIDLANELVNIQELSESLRSNEYVAKVDSWVDKYVEYWDDAITANQTLFPDRLTQFLFSPRGAQYRSRNFRFNSTLSCREDAPLVTATRIDFSYKLLSSSREEVQAMDAVRTVVQGTNMSGETRVWGRAFSSWETNKVIKEELFRNLGIALVVVSVATMVLLASVVASSMVVLCVLFTLVDVAALIHWWGLTIDTVTCIDLVLAVGLCVDYAVHVAHTFLTRIGDRAQRAADTLATIGPPVLSGGFSTFLAFAFLANSSSYVFQSFFKIFFGVCVYGLYHGLVFLPVLLSLVGPASHNTITPQHLTPPHTTSSSSSHPLEQKNGKFVEKSLDAEGGGMSTDEKGNLEKGVGMFVVGGEGKVQQLHIT